MCKLPEYIIPLKTTCILTKTYLLNDVRCNLVIWFKMAIVCSMLEDEKNVHPR